MIGWVTWISLTSHHTLWNNAANIQLIKGTVFPWVKCQAGLNIYNKQAPWGICSCLISFVFKCSLCTLFFLCMCIKLITWFCLTPKAQGHKTNILYILMNGLSTVQFLIQNNPSLLLSLMVLKCFLPFACTTKPETQFIFSLNSGFNNHGWQVAEESCY